MVAHGSRFRGRNVFPALFTSGGKSMKTAVIAILILLLAAPVFAHKIPYRICEPCIDVDGAITVTSSVQVVCGSTAGQPNSEYSYGFYACGGDNLTFSLCPTYGGSASYDTAISIQGPDNCGSYLACNDDYCSVQSEVTWVVPADGNYIVVVDGWSSYEGNYCMGYVGMGVTAAESQSWSVLKDLY
jgi:hypothetical protein